MMVLTTGEPAGIGPDIILTLACQNNLPQNMVVLADTHLLAERAEQLGYPVSTLNTMQIQHVGLAAPVQAGIPDVANAGYVLQQLNIAVEGCLSKKYQSMVTCPIHKAVINDADKKCFFTGHTEFLAQRAGVSDVVMLFVLPSQNINVALTTTHIPLKEVAHSLTAQRLRRVIELTHQGLRSYFNVDFPCLHVAGINPHAGESGYLGTEEQIIMTPVINELNEEGLNVIGPMSADTMFIPKQLEQADAHIMMYHDQGLPVVKSMGFDDAVNVTLGLPFIRTSVDHGTAFSLAGTGQASAENLKSAIMLAGKMREHYSQFIANN